LDYDEKRALPKHPTSLDYLPLPPPLVREVEGYWNAESGPAIKGPATTGKGSRTPG
jgi:hypothetical protein